MPQFTPINHAVEVQKLAPDFRGWKTAQQFKSKGRVIDRYTLIAKKERPYFLPFRIARVFVGVLATVCSGGCLYFHTKSVQKLIWKSSETIRFGVLSLKKKKSSSKSTSKHPARFPKRPKSSTPSVSSSLSTPSSSPVQRPSFFSPVSAELMSPVKLPPITGFWERAIVMPHELEESRRELESGVNVSEETVARVAELMPRILNREKLDGVTYYSSQAVHRVFTLDVEPHLIFKVGTAAGRMKQRFDNAVYVNAICNVHRFAQLVIPSARLIPIEFNGQGSDLFVEHKLAINPHVEAQAQFYLTHARELDLAVSQLAQLICLTGVSDIEPRNNPVVFSEIPDQLPKLALIDLQYLGNPRKGLYGGKLSGRGLIRTISTRYAPQVAKVCAQITKNFSDRSFKRALAKREGEVQEMQQLQEFYDQRGIKEGSEPLCVDVEQLDLTQAAPRLKQRLQLLATELVQLINHRLSVTSPENVIRGRRKMMIRASEQWSNQFVDPIRFPTGTQVTQENFPFTCTGFLLERLIEAGAIFKVLEFKENAFLIQA